jgi:AraC-like DNA-binding protein
MAQRDSHDLLGRLLKMADTTRTNFAYLPVSEIATRLGLYVTGAGSDHIPPDSNYPRQKHPELYDFNWRGGRILPEYQLLFIADGHGEFESQESDPLKVEPGSLIMLFPDVWHRYRPRKETGWTEYWISLGGELLFQWHERGLFSATRPLTRLVQPEDTLRRYQKVINFVTHHPEQETPLLTAHAMSIVASVIEQAQVAPSHLTDLSDASEDPDNDSPSQLVIQATQAIWNRSHQRISVDMIAKQVGVTRRTLERHFRDQLGRTVLQELIACRVQRAQRLLGETKVPIKYVAYAAGFSSLSNLCKVFQRELGTTPGDYRDAAATTVSKRTKRR